MLNRGSKFFTANIKFLTTENIKQTIPFMIYNYKFKECYI